MPPTNKKNTASKSRNNKKQAHIKPLTRGRRIRTQEQQNQPRFEEEEPMTQVEPPQPNIEQQQQHHQQHSSTVAGEQLTQLLDRMFLLLANYYINVRIVPHQ